VKHHTLSSEALHEALFGEDELGVVLRAHFYVEAALEAFIDELIPFPDYLPKLRFEQKAKLACALALDGVVFSPLKELGDLRNSSGHQVGAKLTIGSVNKFFDSFSAQDRSSIGAGYELTRQQMQQTQPMPPLKDLGPRDKFVLAVIALHKILLQSVKEVEGKPLR
jgi:hypothetical protein